MCLCCLDLNIVTCGSSIRLLNVDNSKYLHSHQVSWGSGSGQQSVTGHGGNDDRGSLWVIKEGFGKEFCETGTAIKCGSIIRLEHLNTRKNIHSHLFKSMLSGSQEVSCFGDNGVGDASDNWEVICPASFSTSSWKQGMQTTFKHVDTGKYLMTSNAHEFTQQNCGVQCPIIGQSEVSAAAGKITSKMQWVPSEGLYFLEK